MNTQEHELNKLSEECMEVAQRVSKALRFGINEIQPGQPSTNAQRIEEEFAGLLSAYRRLVRDGVLFWPSDEQCNEAFKKHDQFLAYSRQLGTVKD